LTPGPRGIRYPVSTVVLAASTAVFLLDGLSRWQAHCVTFVGIGTFCITANLWHGSAAGFGFFAEIAALTLLIWIGAGLVRHVDPKVALPVTLILSALLLDLALTKAAIVAGREASYGMWIGLACVIGIAVGDVLAFVRRNTGG